MLLLCSDNTLSTSTGLLFEVGSGWQGQNRWQRTRGQNWSPAHELDPEQVAEKWSNIVDFQVSGVESPDDLTAGLKPILSEVEHKSRL